MINVCNKCKKSFNQDLKSVFCPHGDFPKSCEIHGRYNCGNFSCQTNVKRIPNLEVERKAKDA